ncbi:hypothetical protein AeNC1_007730 [Aphanomyces euteiches]|nr:hypothetical protein AeNC1_007730 [Aphanomyces euteiches]
MVVKKVAIDWLTLVAPIISTITFYTSDDGAPSDLGNIKQFLQARVNAIVQANPWLTGRIVSVWTSVNPRLVFDPHATTLPLEEFFMPTLAPNLNYNDLVATCAPLEVRDGLAVLNADQPLFRIHWITISDTAGALFMSLSHGIGDGYTYYRLYGMLSSDSPVEPLNPHRLADIESRVEVAIKGGNDAMALVKSLPFVLNMVGNMVARRSHAIVVRTINLAWISTEMALFKNSSSVGYVSTNDVVTSWIYRMNGCQVGFMAMNLRGRVDGVDWHFAGNYETVVGYQPEDYATPALIRESIAVNGFRRVNSGKFPWMPRATTSVTSWATLYKPALLPGWSMVEHLPIVRGNMPFFTAFSVIFQRTSACIGIVYGSLMGCNLDDHPAVAH